MNLARRLRSLMLDWAKAIHDAIGIESPRLFIAVFAFIGLILFGITGWFIDRGYRVKLKEQSVQAAAKPIVPEQAKVAATPATPQSKSEENSKKSMSNEQKKQLPVVRLQRCCGRGGERLAPVEQ